MYQENPANISTPAEEALTSQTERFKLALRPRSPEYIQYLTDIYRVHLEQERSLLAQRDIEDLKATGQFPRDSTPFDVVSNPVLQNIEHIVYGQVERHIYLEVLTHQTVLDTFRQNQARTWEPLSPKEIPVLDSCLEEREAVTYEDFVLSIGEGEPSESSAQTVLGTGLVVKGTTETVCFPICGSSMSALNSANGSENLGLSGAMSFVPIDAEWGNPHKQALMLNESHRLLRVDPFLTNHEEAEYLINRATGLMGITLKADPADALTRVETILNEVEYLDGDHKLLCRVYDPRSMQRMVKTVFALRDSRYGDKVVIVGGKVTNRSQALALVKAGAHAVDIGVGEGEICDTPGVTSATGNNLLTAYQIAREGLQIPLICDGGTGRQIPIAIAIGASVAMKSRALSGGTYEHNPTGWVYSNGVDGRGFKRYFGEASDAEKWYGKKFDPTGNDVMFLEGSVGRVEMDSRYPSITKRQFKMLEGLATACIFQRIASLEELQRNPHPDVWKYTSHAAMRASVHHN
ncbi:hypothetical protein CO051_00325 [Candidatus Roizmanbacteria bacterium CG_4_9_14_0_2_um_filter_39_13]|uniref:IMP dehydrogenase/GMP reductase domain-containing protein n=1 Tax=Candidatus Roizmanbacteria bacterium CG_4_9_14_0_2_um_filter_39_13 TaxID=1974839 RepID=A0A2M8F4F6_9BACT|nr:MAG: hypothetical protein COY15_00470 [Candidatus Roizmanbacteria bacterium CG_4_10_14_0_2_um_filter_39_12]PJC34162.1 MAG: hypothetical protein CO051_00325 [Candidatus Roizmanbacteria bacterium CG_4_9_14_0_2_um_filter_39_13]